MKVVLDTGVMVSALVNARGSSAKTLSLILDGDIKILYDNRILFEYIEVLSTNDFGFNIEKINDTIHFVRYEGTFVEADSLDVIFHDEPNKKFYEVYISGEAQYLITGNREHFPEDSAVIIPGDFLKIYEKHKS